MRNGAQADDNTAHEGDGAEECQGADHGQRLHGRSSSWGGDWYAACAEGSEKIQIRVGHIMQYQRQEDKVVSPAPQVWRPPSTRSHHAAHPCSSSPRRKFIAGAIPKARQSPQPSILGFHSEEEAVCPRHLMAKPTPVPRMPTMMPQAMMTIRGWFHLTGRGASSPSSRSFSPSSTSVQRNPSLSNGNSLTVQLLSPLCADRMHTEWQGADRSGLQPTGATAATWICSRGMGPFRSQ